jgi:hypothetical protein
MCIHEFTTSGSQRMKNDKKTTAHKDRFFYLLLAVLIALVVADGSITRFIIKNQLGMEANPFLKEWVRSDALLIIKLAGSLAAAFILWHLYLKRHKVGWILTSFFIAVYVLLILWNLAVFFLASAGRV